MEIGQIDLNTFILQNNLLQGAKNILIKIDCQGAEIPILDRWAFQTGTI